MHSSVLLLSAAAYLVSGVLASTQDPLAAHRIADTIPILKAPEAFHEQLVLKPLNDGSVYSHFQFTTHLGTSLDEEHFDGAGSNLFTHYNLFPRSIGQILHSFEVEELHLTFTQGRWQYSDWGYPLAPSAGTGVELWAWLKDDRKQTDANWKGLTNTLSGLFCASLNFIDETITIEPKMSFRNEGLYNVHTRKGQGNNDTQDHLPRRLRYGSLPHENVCTENLTPWIKLLPCKSKAGIASLLKSHKLFDTRFYSMAIHVRPVCEDELCRVKSLELVQTITTVFDVARHDGSFDWTLAGLFEREIHEACPLATSSKVILNLPQVNRTVDPHQYELVPHPRQGLKIFGTEENPQEVAVYDLREGGLEMERGEDGQVRPFQLALNWKDSRPKAVRTLIPGILAHRYFTGYGQERGGLTIELRNQHDQELEAVYLDTLPWYLKLYLHTFALELNGQPIENQRDIVSKMYYQPAVDRARPAVLELSLRLPPHSIVKFSIGFDKVFLKYTEHPPDANRGFDVGCAVLTATLPRRLGQIGYGGLDHLRAWQDREAELVRERVVHHDWRENVKEGVLELEREQRLQGSRAGHGASREDYWKGDRVRVYTETLLVSLPTPDFSMPYNVITLTCTVIALFFGSMFNLMTRDFVVVEPKVASPPPPPPPPPPQGGGVKGKKVVQVMEEKEVERTVSNGAHE